MQNSRFFRIHAACERAKDRDKSGYREDVADLDLAHPPLLQAVVRQEVLSHGPLSFEYKVHHF